jgi:hypothetical protein
LFSSRGLTVSSDTVGNSFAFSMNIEKLRGNLAQAVEDMSARGLRLSAKWASEQLLGMQASSQFSDVPLHSNSEMVPAGEQAILNFANLLITTGEYQRCAHILRTRRADNNLSSKLGIFLMAYSLYLAGEKIKDQSAAEKTGTLSCALNVHIFK